MCSDEGCFLPAARTTAGKPAMSPLHLRAVALGQNMAFRDHLETERPGDRRDLDQLDLDLVAKTIGLAGCSAGVIGQAGLGLQRCQAIAVDPASCGVAIVDRPTSPDRSVLARISDQSRATCLRQTQGEP